MLNTLTLTDALAKIAAKEVTAQEIIDDVLKVVAEKNPALNAYLTLNDQDLATALPNASKLPLKGVPISVKDNFSTQGLRTTASSTVLDSFIPPYDATVVKKLKAAGGYVVAKANLDAWAHGSSTETSQYGRSLNPRNTNYLPGGSSGGSAAAVAADMCLASIGSETAGSIRQPAAWCGTVGLKPTYGRVSRFGVVAMASSTDSPGPITKTVADAALLLNHIAGHDDRDGTTTTQPVPDFTQALNKDIKGLKVGVVYFDIEGLEGVKKYYEPALKVLENLGAEIEYTTALDPHHAISVYTVVQRGEVSSNLGRYDGIRYGNDRSFLGAEAKRRIMLGTYTLSKGYADKYYLLAQKVRTLFMEDFHRLFAKYDVVISPTSPGFAKKIGATEGAAMFGELEDMLLEPTSITGFPGINIPCYRDPETNLFLGLNIVANMWREDVMIQVADAFEKATNWNTWRH
ncbi:MAG TPA: amidase family protein [Vitreimonas sp.]|nr:amidase family protein [Vitreimonas sp.]